MNKRLGWLKWVIQRNVVDCWFQWVMIIWLLLSLVLMLFEMWIGAFMLFAPLLCVIVFFLFHYIKDKIESSYEEYIREVSKNE